MLEYTRSLGVEQGGACKFTEKVCTYASTASSKVIIKVILIKPYLKKESESRRLYERLPSYLVGIEGKRFIYLPNKWRQQILQLNTMSSCQIRHKPINAGHPNVTRNELLKQRFKKMREKNEIKYNEKSSRRRKYCALAVVRRSQKFRPATDPLPGDAGRPKLISWRWSLRLPTNQVWWGSMHAISSYRGNRPTNTNTHTHKPTDRTDYNTLSLARSVISDVSMCAIL